MNTVLSSMLASASGLSFQNPQSGGRLQQMQDMVQVRRFFRDVFWGYFPSFSDLILVIGRQGWVCDNSLFDFKARAADLLAFSEASSYTIANSRRGPQLERAISIFGGPNGDAAVNEIFSYVAEFLVLFLPMLEDQDADLFELLGSSEGITDEQGRTVLDLKVFPITVSLSSHDTRLIRVSGRRTRHEPWIALRFRSQIAIWRQLAEEFPRLLNSMRHMKAQHWIPICWNRLSAGKFSIALDSLKPRRISNGCERFDLHKLERLTIARCLIDIFSTMSKNYKLQNRSSPFGIPSSFSSGPSLFPDISSVESSTNLTRFNNHLKNLHGGGVVFKIPPHPFQFMGLRRLYFRTV